MLRNWFLTLLLGAVLLSTFSIHRAALVKPEKPFRLLSYAAACFVASLILLFVWLLATISLVTTDWDSVCPRVPLESKMLSGVTCDTSYRGQFILVLFTPFGFAALIAR
eukprot:Blabericola_migrator_1__2450@NODE_168_length_12126_cov_91_620864_g146_i0_p10_GENE_NODE_168_length_12126_cov_91_620864_g146_i0NODE_168_length_12126_cov_91_620864_g146_i0_p10_ORF_typecomplete_len109_score1_387tm_3/PF00003_22/0_00025XKrelated/PF09815_9/0_0035DUF3169/PF11368_8/0_056LMBR1/PF04791_16/0_34DUF4239/PF14023_6/2_2_NODE_168_length_12126_cov_91_620864_g146_i016001926